MTSQSITNTTDGRAAKDRAAIVTLANFSAAAADVMRSIADIRASPTAVLAAPEIKRLLKVRRDATHRAAVLSIDIEEQRERELNAKPGEIPDDLAPFMYLNESPEMRDLKRKHTAAINRRDNAGKYLNFLSAIHDKTPEELFKLWTALRRDDELNALNGDLNALRRDEAHREDYFKHVAPFDAQTTFKPGVWSIYTPQPRPEYADDTTQYTAINKQVRYIDLSPGQVLKVLLQQGKICEGAYFEALKRAQQGKRQRGRTEEQISRYYATLKGKTGKWGRTAFNHLIGIRRIEGETQISPDLIGDTCAYFERDDGTIATTAAAKLTFKTEVLKYCHTQHRPFYHATVDGARYRVELKRGYARRIKEPLPLTYDAPRAALALARFAVMFGEGETSAAELLFIEEEIRQNNEARRAQKAAELLNYATTEFKTRLRNSNILLYADAPTPRRD